MKLKPTIIIACLGSLGLVAGLTGCKTCPCALGPRPCGTTQQTAGQTTGQTATANAELTDQHYKIKILCQPQDQMVRLGQPAKFTVVAGVRPPWESVQFQYQWQVNVTQLVEDAPDTYFEDIGGATNWFYEIPSVTTDHIGFYRVIVSGSPQEASEPAALQAYQPGTLATSPITVYATPTASNGRKGSCPGTFVGFVKYLKPAPAWGWTTVTGSSSGLARDKQKTSTKVEAWGWNGDAPCAGSGQLSFLFNSSKYQFTIYFPSGTVPTGNYSLELTNFNE